MIGAERRMQGLDVVFFICSRAPIACQGYVATSLWFHSSLVRARATNCQPVLWFAHSFRWAGATFRMPKRRTERGGHGWGCAPTTGRERCVIVVMPRRADGLNQLQYRNVVCASPSVGQYLVPASNCRLLFDHVSRYLRPCLVGRIFGLLRPDFGLV